MRASSLPHGLRQLSREVNPPRLSELRPTQSRWNVPEFARPQALRTFQTARSPSARPSGCSDTASPAASDRSVRTVVVLPLGVRRPFQRNQAVAVAAKLRNCRQEREYPVSCCRLIENSPCTLLERWRKAMAGTGNRDPPGTRIWWPRILIYCRIIEKPRAHLSHSKRQYRHEPALFSIQAAT